MEGIKKLPQMGFGESVKTVLKNLLNFNGRARRSELWWYWLAYLIVAGTFNILLQNSPLVSGIVSIVLQLTLWSVTVRRLHDRGHGGWWVTVSILLSVFGQVYLQGSGFYEMMQSVNPDIEELTAAFRDPVFMLCGLVSLILNITILVFCLRDSKPETNKYGLSPKYVATNDNI